MDRVDIRPLLLLAADQFGLFSLDQARRAGITRAMIRTALEHGWIRRERRGVYAIVGAPRAPWSAIYAAALAAGSPAVISHTSAAVIHSLFGIAARGVELTLPRENPRRLQGVTVHRTSSLIAGDVESGHGVAITTPVRTVVDLAGRFRDPFLGKIVDEGIISRLWTAETISRRLDQLAPTCPGYGELRKVLTIRLSEGQPDSQLEQRVLRVVKRSFPGYVLHHQLVLDGEVIILDIAWPRRRIDAEVDGMAVRAASRSKFERASRRENLLVAHGWRVVHLTAQMNEAAIIAQLAPLFAS